MRILLAPREAIYQQVFRTDAGAGLGGVSSRLQLRERGSPCPRGTERWGACNSSVEILTEAEASQGWFGVGPEAVAKLQQSAAAVPVEYHRQWGGLYVVALTITDGG